MKKYFLLAAASLCFLPIFTIAQVIEWQNTIGGSGNDQPYSIQQTTDGGYILGGVSSSNMSGDKTENCIGGLDYWILKTDAAGILQWENTIGGNGHDYLYSIDQTSDGGYILGGGSSSNISGDKTENCMGNTDFWIVKTDASGVIQWQNTIGGGNFDELYSIEQTTDGGYILGGQSNSYYGGDKSENSVGGVDYWIVKTDASGNIQWQNTIGGASDEYLLSLHQTVDGGYILGGYSFSNISGDKTENSNGLADYWIVKTDSSGVIQWQNTIGGSENDYFQSIQQTNDGGYILGGFSKSNISGDKSENNYSGFFDYWIIKTDASGNIQWQNTIGGSHEEELYSIRQTADGGYLLGGCSNSEISGDKTEQSIGSFDYWVVKTDSSGVIQWQNTIGGNLNDNFKTMAPTDDGGYLLSGWSGSDISGDKTENCKGNDDFWIVKITDQFNSITGKLFIDANSNGMQDAGEPQIINKQVTENNTGNFGFSGPNGIYYVSVLDSGNFSVSPPALNYYTIVPISHSANFTGIQQTDSLNDFAFQPAGVFNDLCVTITPLGPFRAGFNANYQITYENLGTTTLNPTVIFYPDNDISFVSATPIANTVTIDSLVWSFGPLSPLQTGSILVTVYVDVSAPIGTLINSGAIIEPISGDANTICNQSYWEAFTTGSFDPNDILVDQDTLLATQFPIPPYLEYLIRFQNTGNDTAFTVKLLNPIDTNKLDFSTIEFVTSSHPVSLTWLPWEKNMEFLFENILLADSIANEPASHGFVRYRIKPKSSLTLGDTITNYAAIYFDFNAPVITNTAITRIVLPTSMYESIETFDNLLMYPNPANSTLTIETGILQTSEYRLTISDIAGRILFSNSFTFSSTQHRFDISSFSKGIYFVQLQASQKISRGRFVKE